MMKKKIKKVRFHVKNFHEKDERKEKILHYIKSELKRVPQKINTRIEKNIKSSVHEKYTLNADGAEAGVEIKMDDNGIKYNLIIPEIDVATKVFLEELRNELISVINVSMKELVDQEAFNTVKARFLAQAKKIIKQKLPNVGPNVEQLLIGRLIHEMLGLGEIEFLINDPSLEEIVITSSKENIRVFSRKYGWVETNLKVPYEEEIINYSNIIARHVGRQITILNPLLDAYLITGDRINAVLYPINTKGNTITIRKFSRDPFTIVDLINNKTCDLEIAALIWFGIEFETNILISGGTGSGKTSFLNACMPFVPPNQRIISIEDTRELTLPNFLYWTPLVTRIPNPEGKGEVSMLDLLINSLRMRPDRIILGEMRRKEEAMVLFEAMHTGHSVYATVHADSAPETISRLINPPISVPPNLLKAVGLNVVMFRDRRKGIRRVFQVAEFDAEKDNAYANIIYRWSQEQDKIVKHNESIKFFETLTRNTGMSQKEMNDYLKEKQNILTWMIKNNIRSLNNFGKVMNVYYKNKEKLLEMIKRNDVKDFTEGNEKLDNTQETQNFENVKENGMKKENIKIDAKNKSKEIENGKKKEK
ncbi:MAG: ATPase, T2SS/T4P/T4SS family [Nanoarchaeota archaeon]